MSQCLMPTLRQDFWDATHVTDTATVSEVFIPLATLAYCLFSLAIWWWYLRKNRPLFRTGVPRWMVWVVCLHIPVLGIIALVFAFFAFVPGELWG